MACFNKIFSAGIVAGTIINFFLVFIIYYLNLKISKKLTNSLLCGIMASFVLILNQSFCIELFMGFSIPLTIIFYQIIVYIFLFNEKINMIYFGDSDVYFEEIGNMYNLFDYFNSI